MTHEVRGINATAAVSNIHSEDWLVLQPLWDVVLTNSYYTSSPLFLIFVANGFYFVCMIPYVILDFYGLDHWNWVKRYKIYPDIRVTWSHAWSCLCNTLWNQVLIVMPLSIMQWVWFPSVELPTRAPTFFEFIWQPYVALCVFDLLYYIWHIIHHRVPILYKYLHSIHHRYSRVNIWVAQYDHPWELISLGVLGTISPMMIGAHPLNCWTSMMLNDWVGADSHAGYDLPGLPHRWFPFWGGPIKHAMHHQRPLTNFQPYFNWFDRLFGTECPGVQANGYRSPELIEWERQNAKKHKSLD